MLHDLLDALGWASASFARAWYQAAPYLGAAWLGALAERHLTRTRYRKVSPMGYRNPLIRIDLGAELGDDFADLFVTLRNPRLQSPATLTPPEVETDADGKAKDTGEAMQATAVMLARLVYDWNLPDPGDPAGEDAEAMPIHHRGELKQGPAAEDVAKMPAAVFTRITQMVAGAVNPQ